MAFIVEDKNIVTPFLGTQGMFAPGLLAQTFVATRTYTIAKIQLAFIVRDPAFNVSGGIYSVSAGRPQSQLTGFSIQTPPGTTGNIETSEVVLGSPIELTEDTEYAILVEGPPLPKGIAWATTDGGDDYYSQGVAMLFFNDVWSDLGQDKDFHFITYSEFVFSPPEPSGINNMVTIKRVVAAANNKVFYET